MARIDLVAPPALIPAPEPSRRAYGALPPTYSYLGGGTGPEPEGVIADPRLAPWLPRYKSWRRGFEGHISSAAKRYWRLWRNSNDYAPPGPNSEWRDRTQVPEFFKIVENRLPRKMMTQFPGPEWMSVEGRERKDEFYEELVKSLVEVSFDEIGQASKQGGFLTRVYDGFHYCEVMGHVWWRMWWKRDLKWIKTKLPRYAADGKIAEWIPYEAVDLAYDGLDLQWLPLDSLAVPLKGEDRRWAIERIQTSYQTMLDDNKAHLEATGQPLYSVDALTQLLGRRLSATAVDKEGYEEPRDTETWPLGDDQAPVADADDFPVELWLCWDNRHRTLTKVADKAVVLAHGHSPTPDGLDPYWDLKAVPIPGRVYGDSLANWVEDLCNLQSRIKRNRADEVLLSLWQQFVYKSGSLKSPQTFLRPGGAIGIEDPLNPNADIRQNFMWVQRHPVLPEAYTEEQYTQSQAEAASGMDSISMGVEATSKSRDVTATETQQRVLQGNARFQMENLYIDVAWKQPLLRKAWDLIRMNLTRPKMVRVLGQDQPIPVTLADLTQPVDFKLGGGLFEISRADRKASVERFVTLAGTPAFAQWFKQRETLTELVRLEGWKDAARFVKTQEEYDAEQAKQMAMAAAAQGMAGPGGAAPPPSPSSGLEGEASPGTLAPALPGVSPAAALAGVAGGSSQPPPAATGPLAVEEF